MKVTAPITQKQIKEAQTFVEDNGYTESFTRRFATIDDIKVSEILHSNVGGGELKRVSIFDNVAPTRTRPKRNEFEGVEEVSIEKFMSEILPSCSSVEAYLQNSQEGNLVSLTTAEVENSKKIFKWDNNYSWTFKGNLAGKSQIKDAVKSQGGKVDGVLRFSIMWAEDSEDNSDLDAHCVEPNGNVIYYGSALSRVSGGNLDIDITQPQSHKRSNNKEVVENITFPRLETMPDGKYDFKVHQFSARRSKGFKAEIEFDGEIYSYEYKAPVDGKISVATVVLENGKFQIQHQLPETSSAREMYGLKTGEFHKVNLVCLSPNHWGDNTSGNKHYFFMLDKCKAEGAIRTFHNENLKPELAEHRRVLEILANTTKIESSEDQLSGLGFNATVRDELIVKLAGSHKRVIKIKF